MKRILSAFAALLLALAAVPAFAEEPADIPDFENPIPEPDDPTQVENPEIVPEEPKEEPKPEEEPKPDQDAKDGE